MKKISTRIAFSVIASFIFQVANSQIGIGTNNPDSSAMLEVLSTTKGLLPPRMTTAQILAIKNPAAGLIAYNSNRNKPVYFDGSDWRFYCGDSVLYDGNISSGLIAYFPFNGNFNDESGKGNHGTPSSAGGTLTTAYNGAPNSAFNCNGNGQQLIVNNNGLIAFDSTLTISFNAMVRNVGRYHFVSMVKYSDGSGASFSTGNVFAPGNSNFLFSTVNNTAPCNDPFVGAYSTNQNANFILAPESWYNIICTYNKGVMKVFINGQLYSTQTTTTQKMNFCTGTQILIGGWWQQDPAASLNGKIDEVRLYNRVVNAEEIKELSRQFR